MNIDSFSASDGGLEYLANKVDIKLDRGATVSSADLIKATVDFDEVIDRFFDFDINIAELLGMRNLSSFVGELFASRLARVVRPMLRKNPHQDGYPDLLLMDDKGQRLWDGLIGQQQEKKPFSPFPGGGIEIKATCGNVPTPQQLAKIGLRKPGIGDSRAQLLKSYDWKAHHRNTNNLLGIFWDFVDAKPKIIGVFFSNALTIEDWGEIVQPRAGGGNTTSVSIMTRAGVKKMCSGWVIMLNSDKHIQFVERYNGVSLKQQAINMFDNGA